MLVEFVNCRPEEAAFVRFKNKWERVGPQKWAGDHKDFLWSESLVRAIWEGRKKGIEGFQVMLGLGIQTEDTYADENDLVPASPIAVDWDLGRLVLVPRKLEDVIWLTLLQQSRRLGICADKDNGCPTPYFVKYRPQQEFCSDACALPRQREFKRRWWAEHGREWQQSRQHKRGTIDAGPWHTKETGS